MTAPAPRLRLDKWLWHARFFKTRSLAAKQVGAGHVRVNSDKVSKPAHGVKLGDVLTFAQGRRIRVVEVRAFGERRGPAPEAQTLYLDLNPEPVSDLSEVKDKAFDAVGYARVQRPSKRDRRRALGLKRGEMLE